MILVLVCRNLSPINTSYYELDFGKKVTTRFSFLSYKMKRFGPSFPEMVYAKTKQCVIDLPVGG
jgi:hypothetical protein